MVKQLDVMLWGQRVGTLIAPVASVAVQNGLPVYGVPERWIKAIEAEIALRRGTILATI